MSTYSTKQSLKMVLKTIKSCIAEYLIIKEFLVRFVLEELISVLFIKFSAK